MALLAHPMGRLPQRGQVNARNEEPANYRHRIHHTGMVIVWLLLGAACNAPGLIGGPPSGLDRPTPAEPVNNPTAPSSPSERPAASPTPQPTPLPDELVWFAPNMGSTDYAALFSDPDAWAAARSQVDVFKFYAQNVMQQPCDICGDNALGAFAAVNAFELLQGWAIATAVEVPAVKEWGCQGEEGFQAASTVIQNVQANGGRVTLLAMDEPMLYGQEPFGDLNCGLSLEETAQRTARYIQRIQSIFPGVLVGDIEPYPHYSVSQLKTWIETLESFDGELAFFHLDVDIERVRVEGQAVRSDLQALEVFCQEHEIGFGVIITSNWTAAGANRSYVQSALGWAETVADAIGRPDHLIFQSWQGPAPSGRHEIPVNLTPNAADGYSHTQLILDGLALFDQ